MTEQAWTKEDQWPTWKGPGRNLTTDDGGPMGVIDEVHYNRARACAVALAGIEDPAALRKLLDDLRQWRHNQWPDDSNQRPALYAILDALYDLIPEPVGDDSPKPGDQSETN